MAFRDWLTSDGVAMPLYPWLNSAGDKFVEHGHRLLGMLAGLATIALAASLWRHETRTWVRWLGAGLLVAVILQGVLGGQRVRLDEHAVDQARVLALIHGCTGPLFFAAAVGLVVVTSKRWQLARQWRTAASRRVFRVAVATAILAYLQLVFGAVVRHSPMLLAERAGTLFQSAVQFHLLLACILVAHVVWLATVCWRHGVLTKSAAALAMLLALQVLLGVASWVVKYGLPRWFTQWAGETGHFNRASDLASAAVLSGHGAVGAAIVAITLAIALSIGRMARATLVNPGQLLSDAAGATG